MYINTYSHIYIHISDIHWISTGKKPNPNPNPIGLGYPNPKTVGEKLAPNPNPPDPKPADTRLEPDPLPSLAAARHEGRKRRSAGRREDLAAVAETLGRRGFVAASPRGSAAAAAGSRGSEVVAAVSGGFACAAGGSSGSMAAAAIFELLEKLWRRERGRERGGGSKRTSSLTPQVQRAAGSGACDGDAWRGGGVGAEQQQH
jgi:hypothetical protein